MKNLNAKKNPPGKKRRRSNVVEKFRKVSDSIWVSFEAVIIEKTIKEECTKQNYLKR